jgi:hypothetical protein
VNSRESRNAQQFWAFRETFQWHSRCDPNARRSIDQQEVTVPSPLFDALFLIALLVPIAMYLTGMMILAASLILKHWAMTNHHLGDHALAAAH